MKRVLGFAVSVLSTAAVWAQAPQVLPVPITGGDVVLPSSYINIFTPGVVGAPNGPFDGLNAEPHVFTNFDGVIAMGYTLGTATDNAGKQYQIITDIRVYQGDYIGAQSTFPAGGTASAKAHGTFVEI